MRRQKLTILRNLAIGLAILSHTGLLNASTPAKNNRNTVINALDTLLIAQNIERGKKFYDGPSDSLMYYFKNALSLIETYQTTIPQIEQNPENPFYRTLLKYQKDALIQLGIEYFLQGEYSLSLKHHFRALAVAEVLQDISAISECYGEIGTIYNNKGEYQKALEYQQKALDIAHQMEDEDWIAICNNNIGNVYKKKSFYALALKHYHLAHNYFVSQGQHRRIAAVNQNIADIYFAQKHYHKALELYQNNLQLSIETANKQRQADSYLLMGMSHIELNNLTEAKQCIEKSMELYQVLGYSHGLEDCNMALGEVCMQEGRPATAITYFQTAAEQAILANDKASHCEALSKLGNAFIHLKDFEKAEANLAKALIIANDIQALELSKNIHRLLSEIYEKTLRKEEALFHFKAYNTLNDSIYNATQYRIISEMEALYNINAKEQEILLLSERSKIQALTINKRTRLLAFSLMIVISILITAYLYIHNIRLKAARKAIGLENQLLRSQMNPHFIFNALIAIQSFFYENKPALAGDFLAKFARLIRMTFENTKTEYVSMEKELELLTIYLELQALRFENKFDYSLEYAPEIDPSTLLIPPMLTQPFIENAIEHGLRNKNENGFLHIRFEKIQNTLSATIHDNGIGREASRMLRKEKQHLSVAVPMIKDRLKVLGKKHKQVFSLSITDLYDPNKLPSGTLVKINMPALPLS